MPSLPSELWLVRSQPQSELRPQAVLTKQTKINEIRLLAADSGTDAGVGLANNMFQMSDNQSGFIDTQGWEDCE